MSPSFAQIYIDSSRAKEWENFHFDFQGVIFSGRPIFLRVDPALYFVSFRLHRGLAEGCFVRERLGGGVMV